MFRRMCWGGDFTGEKLDGAEGMRRLGASWINRGEDGDDVVRGVVDFIRDEDLLTGFIINISMSI